MSCRITADHIQLGLRGPKAHRNSQGGEAGAMTTGVEERHDRDATDDA